MKKLPALLLSLILLLFVVASGCSNTATTQPTQTSTAPTQTSTAVTATTTPTAPATAAADKAKYGGTLRIVNSYHSVSPPGWPLDTATNMQVLWYIQYITCEPLATMTSSGSVELWLAESYQLDTKSATPSVTFKLKKGIKFQDGTDFNADAVKFQLDKVIEAKGNNSKYWTSIDVLDTYTVKVNLSKFLNTFWQDISNTNCFFVSPTPFKEKGVDWVREHLIGTGPFIMTKWEKDVGATFEKNPNYWQPGKPYLDKIITTVVPDDITMGMALQAGTADMMFLQETKMMRDMALAGFNIIVRPAGVTNIVPDSKNPDSIFADIKVRQAMNYAMDKEAIANALGYGLLRPTSQVIGYGNLGYDPAIPENSYDLEKAKQLLTEAGYPDGFTTEIITWPVDINYALIVKEQLAKVGIKATISSYEWVKFADYWMNGWKDALLVVSYSHYPNFAATALNQWPPYGKYHVSVAEPEGMGDLINASLAATTPEEIEKINRQLSNLIYDNMMVISLTTGGRGAIVSPKIQGHDLYFGYDRMNSFRAADTFLVK